MKRNTLVTLSALSALLATVPAASAERLEPGTVEIGGSMLYDFESSVGKDLELSLLGGTYVAYGWLVGGEAHYGDNDLYTRYALMAMVERSFDFGSADTMSPFVPYVGAGLGFGHSSVNGGDDATAAVLSGKLGIKLMLTGDLAVDLGLYADFATDDIYGDKDGMTDKDFTIRLGLRTFLF